MWRELSTNGRLARMSLIYDLPWHWRVRLWGGGSSKYDCFFPAETKQRLYASKCTIVTSAMTRCQPHSPKTQNSRKSAQQECLLQHNGIDIVLPCHLWMPAACEWAYTSLMELLAMSSLFITQGRWGNPPSPAVERFYAASWSNGLKWLPLHCYEKGLSIQHSQTRGDKEREKESLRQYDHDWQPEGSILGTEYERRHHSTLPHASLWMRQRTLRVVRTPWRWTHVRTTHRTLWKQKQHRPNPTWSSPGYECYSVKRGWCTCGWRKRLEHCEGNRCVGTPTIRGQNGSHSPGDLETGEKASGNGDHRGRERKNERNNSLEVNSTSRGVKDQN